MAAWICVLLITAAVPEESATQAPVASPEVRAKAAAESGFVGNSVPEVGRPPKKLRGDIHGGAVRSRYGNRPGSRRCRPPPGRPLRRIEPRHPIAAGRATSLGTNHSGSFTEGQRADLPGPQPVAARRCGTGEGDPSGSCEFRRSIRVAVKQQPGSRRRGRRSRAARRGRGTGGFDPTDHCPQHVGHQRRAGHDSLLQSPARACRATNRRGT